MSQAVANSAKRVVILFFAVYFLGESASAQKLVGAGVAIGGVTCYSLAKLYADGQAKAKKASRAGPTTRSKRTTPPEGFEPNPGKEGGFVRTKSN